MDYSFFRKNIVSSNEACEILNISRQRLFNLVKLGELKPIIHEKAFSLFLRKDIISIKYSTPFNTSAPIIDMSASTSRSVEFFNSNIDKLDTIESLSIFQNYIDSAVNGFFIPDNYVGSQDMRFIVSPHLIIRDIKGKELWIANCNCGYSGEGPRGSKTIIMGLISKQKINTNLNEQKINDIISNHQIIHFHFENDTQILTKDSSYSFGHKNKVLCRNNNIILIDYSKKHEIDIHNTMEKYSSFILLPKRIVYYPTYQSVENNGMCFKWNSSENCFCNCKIIDQSENELWIYLPNDNNTFFSKNKYFQDLLDYFEINLPKKKLSVFKQNIKSIFSRLESDTGNEPIIVDI